VVPWSERGATWTHDRLDDLSKRVDDTVLATLATVIART
jgi:hypothetical protein